MADALVLDPSEPVVSHEGTPRTLVLVEGHVWDGGGGGGEGRGLGERRFREGPVQDIDLLLAVGVPDVVSRVGAAVVAVNVLDDLLATVDARSTNATLVREVE